jgi:exosome complex component RRP42
LAAVAALLNTKMPNYEVEDGEVKIKSGNTQLPIKQHPVTVTCAKIGDKLVVDPQLEEEQVMDARLSMAIDDDEEICAIQKGGTGYFTPEQVVEFGKLAVQKAKEMRKKLDW